jgi:hypothetical protein
MSYEIYLCGDCLGPIWFPYGQKTHLGTGWYCWKEYHDEEDEGLELEGIVGEFVFGTDPDLLDTLVAEVIGLYAARKWETVPFLQRQLGAGRSDVVHGFLRHLVLKKEPVERVRAVVGQIRQTPEWIRFARGATRRAALVSR